MDVSTRSEVLRLHSTRSVPLAFRKIGTRAFRALRAAGSALVRRVRSLSPEHMFWLGMALMALLYLLILLGVPTSAGRANR
ncbi:MAG: hypothetical protein GTO22_19575 [Gemmatimonadales bacterium]|nr:hypothetical protein [Gemmatimonadales bacterium]